MGEALAASRPHGACSFLLSLDSDAALANEGVCLPQLLAALPPGKSVFLAKDPPMWPPPQGWESEGVFCAGFVLIRLDDAGRRFLESWLASYDPGCWWQDEEGRWSTDGKWAGPAYEQGQLNRLACESQMRECVFELPQVLFNAVRVQPPGSAQPLVAHLMRRPGEWGKGEKEARVAASFRMLLEKHASLAHESPPWGGLPTSAEALAEWEREEEC